MICEVIDNIYLSKKVTFPSNPVKNKRDFPPVHHSSSDHVDDFIFILFGWYEKSACSYNCI